MEVASPPQRLPGMYCFGTDVDSKFQKEITHRLPRAFPACICLKIRVIGPQSKGPLFALKRSGHSALSWALAFRTTIQAELEMRRFFVWIFLTLTVPAYLCSQTPTQRRTSELARRRASVFSQVRIVLDTQVGDYAGLGFAPPHAGWALDLEMPLGGATSYSAIAQGGRRFEYQPTITFSLDRKTGSMSSFSLNVRNEGIVWLNHRLGAEGGIEYAGYWQGSPPATASNPVPVGFYGLHKLEWVPSTGLVVRNALRGRPGRLYVDYLFQTGCQRATPSNPCQVQSPRTQGVQAAQEFRVWSFVRIGGEIAVVHYYDQSNQNDPTVPRVGHTTAYGTLHFKVEWPYASTRSGSSSQGY